MKLQVAIDRKNIEDTFKIAQTLDGIVDIVEIGTTIIKEFGVASFKELKLTKSKLLFDTKTNDEGDFEFKTAFDNGADIATVMGAIDMPMIKKVYEFSQSQNKEVLIDLLNLKMEQITPYKNLDNAIFGLHNLSGVDAIEAVNELHQTFPNIKRIAVAGGIDLSVAKKLRTQNTVEVVIVGGAILKADDIVLAAKEFKEAIN